MSHEKYRSCIDACTRCVEECANCCGAKHEDHGTDTAAACLRLDCAQVCRLAIDLMGRDSAFVSEVCGVCAKICDTCAMEYTRHPHDHCRRCAEFCRRCAEECRRIVAQARTEITRDDWTPAQAIVQRGATM